MPHFGPQGGGEDPGQCWPWGIFRTDRLESRLHATELLRKPGRTIHHVVDTLVHEMIVLDLNREFKRRLLC